MLLLLFLLTIAVCRAANAPFILGSCKIQKNPVVVVTDTSCTVKGRFWFNDRNSNYGVDNPCSQFGWLFSPMQPKQCEIQDVTNTTYNVRPAAANTPIAAVIHGWCKVLEGVRFSRDDTHCNVSGYVIVADKEVALKHPPNHGHVFHINRPCEQDSWLFDGKNPTKCAAFSDSSGVQFVRNEASEPPPPPPQHTCDEPGFNMYKFIVYAMIASLIVFEGADKFAPSYVNAARARVFHVFEAGKSKVLEYQKRD